MNSNHGIVVQLLKNKNNGMYYKAVANSMLFMWSPRAKAWLKPCTKYGDMMNTIENYDLVSDRDSEYLAKTMFI